MLEKLRGQARTNNVRVTLHAHQEMIEESISLDEVLEAIAEDRSWKTMLNIEEAPAACYLGVPEQEEPSTLFALRTVPL